MFVYIMKFKEEHGPGRGLTTSYHDGGGIVAVADGLPQILGMAETWNDMANGDRIDNDWPPKVNIHILEDPISNIIGCYRVSDDANPEFWLFENAGCC